MWFTHPVTRFMRMRKLSAVVAHTPTHETSLATPSRGARQMAAKHKRPEQEEKDHQETMISPLKRLCSSSANTASGIRRIAVEGNIGWSENCSLAKLVVKCVLPP